MTTHVVHASQYGHSARYAEWIAQGITDRSLDKDVTVHDATSYAVTPAQAPSTLVFVAGVYGGPLHKVETFHEAARAYPDATLVLVSVSMAAPSRAKEVQAIWDKNVPQGLQDRVFHVHARGGVDFSRLSGKHKIVMTAVRGFYTAKPASMRHPDDQALLDTWGQDFDASSAEQIEPVFAALRG